MIKPSVFASKIMCIIVDIVRMVVMMVSILCTVVREAGSVEDATLIGDPPSLVTTTLKQKRILRSTRGQPTNNSVSYYYLLFLT